MNFEHKNVAIYARVSSERQDVDLSISAQLKALREYAARNSLTVVKEYVDEAESGRSIDRPGFKQMIVAARQKPSQFQSILVWKLSRFARNREDSIIYKSLLRKQGVQVVSINEQFEDTPSGRLLEGIIEVIDEFYSANLSQDVTRGMRESASRGFFSGGPAPYGYRRVKVTDGAVQRVKLEIDPVTGPIVRRIFEESLSGKGMVEITRDLNKDGLTTRKHKPWSKNTVGVVLNNEAYVGTLVWGRATKHGAIGTRLPVVRTEAAYPQLVDKTTFDRVRAFMASRAPKITHPRVVHSEYILSGLIKCRRCDVAMIGHAVKSGDFFYYMCGNARRRGRGLCSTRLLRKERIEEFVIDRLKQYILTDENLSDLVRLTNEDMARASEGDSEKLDTLKVQLEETEGRLARLYDALETGEFETQQLAPRIKTLLQRKEDLAMAKAAIEDAAKTRRIEMASPEMVKTYAQSLRELIGSTSVMQKKAFLRSFVQRIDVGDNDVKITYTMPMLPEKSPTEDVGVLPFTHDGPPLWSIPGT
jgi:site-specific DNA recombinase